mgnify:CR=1 FL=1
MVRGSRPPPTERHHRRLQAEQITVLQGPGTDPRRGSGYWTAFSDPGIRSRWTCGACQHLQPRTSPRGWCLGFKAYAGPTGSRQASRGWQLVRAREPAPGRLQGLTGFSGAEEEGPGLARKSRKSPPLCPPAFPTPEKGSPKSCSRPPEPQGLRNGAEKPPVIFRYIFGFRGAAGGSA